MKPIMFYDTETTGLPIYDRRSSDPRQPHIVQAAAILVDEGSRKIMSSFELIASPNGWGVSDEVAKIHGITTEIAAWQGIEEELIVQALYMMNQCSSLRIGHNEQFDARIVRIGLKRFLGDDAAETWKKTERDCTANLATPICKLPATPKMVAAGREKQAKRAKLSEAYEFFTGKKLEGAHSAMADTLGCMEVYFAIKDGHQEGSGPKQMEITATRDLVPPFDDVDFLGDDS